MHSDTLEHSVVDIMRSSSNCQKALHAQAPCLTFKHLNYDFKHGQPVVSLTQAQKL